MEVKATLHYHTPLSTHSPICDPNYSPQEELGSGYGLRRELVEVKAILGQHASSLRPGVLGRPPHCVGIPRDATLHKIRMKKGSHNSSAVQQQCVSVVLALNSRVKMHCLANWDEHWQARLPCPQCPAMNVK